MWIFPPDGSHAGINHTKRVENDRNPSGDLSSPVDGCWQVNGVGSNDIALTRSIRPCGTLEQTYSVYADADNGNCLPAGRYQFEGTYWTFDLRVEL